MRIALFPLALFLTACGSAEGEYPLEEHRADFIRTAQEQGHSLAKAEAMWQRSREIDEDPEIAHRVEQKQAEIEALQTDKCERAPYLEGC